MTPTPRTDDEWNTLIVSAPWDAAAEHMAQVARQLERELDFSEKTGMQIWAANERLKADRVALERGLAAWEAELSKVMPPDFKDWWQNSKAEWPLVARLVIEGKNRERDAADEYAERMERELAALTEDVGKCHDVLGEDRASDTSELWKFFETHKQLIHRLRCREEDLAAERDLADRLAALLQQDRDGYGGQKVDDDCDCCDCEYLRPIDEALAVWKEARSGTV